VDPRVGPDAVARIKKTCHLRKSNTGRRAHSLVTVLTEPSYTDGEVQQVTKSHIADINMEGLRSLVGPNSAKGCHAQCPRCSMLGHMGVTQFLVCVWEQRIELGTVVFCFVTPCSVVE
jgi:hypothetical protein